MGSAISTNMEKMAANQKANMNENRTHMMMAQMAVQVARMRDIFMFFGTFYGLTAPLLLLLYVFMTRVGIPIP